VASREREAGINHFKFVRTGGYPSRPSCCGTFFSRNTTPLTGLPVCNTF
jgi:hypothetical protein